MHRCPQRVIVIGAVGLEQRPRHVVHVRAVCRQWQDRVGLRLHFIDRSIQEAQVHQRLSPCDLYDLGGQCFYSLHIGKSSVVTVHFNYNENNIKSPYQNKAQIP